MCRSTFLREPNRELRTLRQPGGVAIIANVKYTSHIVSLGNDARKLGRWRWITLRGKDQHKLCIIGAYKTGAAWMTSLNQAVALQTVALGTTPCDIDPTVLWIQDMRELVQCRQQEGCKIILAGISTWIFHRLGQILMS